MIQYGMLKFGLTLCIGYDLFTWIFGTEEDFKERYSHFSDRIDFFSCPVMKCASQ